MRESHPICNLESHSVRNRLPLVYARLSDRKIPKMPIEYWIDEELDLCFARWWGAVSAEQARENLATYLADPRYRPGRRELIDIRELSAAGMSGADLIRFLDRINSQPFPDGVGTLTVLLAGSDLSFGLARRFQGHGSLRGGIRIQVFRDERAALSAMGLEVSGTQELMRG